MAFHGNRGGARGGARGGGRGGIRGNSSRGGSRGGFRGSSSRGGPGRGRGGFRGGGKPIFDSARLAQQKEQDEESQSGAENSGNEDLELSSEGEGSAEDEELLSASNAYTQLMKSFADDAAAPQAKRRKLDHIPGPEPEVDDELKEDQNTVDADEVDEPEEGPETATEGLLEEYDVEDASDPFQAHFADAEDNILARRLEGIKKQQWASRKVILPKVGRALVSVPKEQETALQIPINSPAQLKLKQKLACVATKLRPTFDALEKSIAPTLFSYQDMLYCERTTKNSENLRHMVCLHALNHVFKTRDRVIKNNARLAKEEHGNELELRDQGFTRPKVLMILPTRESCVRMVKMIKSLCEPEQEENRKRFEDSYVDPDTKFSDDKPEDFRELFGGNDDDMFRIGMKFTRKTVKYFSQFYNSDIIFASSLGLRMVLEGKEDKKGDSDFLSSIEIVIVDQADALLMQNWEHVEYVFQHLNMQPKEAHGCDFSRVRNWYLNDNAQYFRQTIALSAFNTPELNLLFYNQSKNWAGKVRITGIYPGALQELGLKVKQTFSRLESSSYTNEPDDRFTYFISAVIPALTRRAKDSAGTLIFIPSYLDFVRVRNYFVTSATTSSLSFGSISEYTSVRDVARARSHFFSGRHNVLLYTERAHHFRRYQLRGVRKVILYALPENPLFYKEIVGGYLGRSIHEGNLEPGTGSVRAIFSKWDALKLERIVGTERVGRMTSDKGDTFDFV